MLPQISCAPTEMGKVDIILMSTYLKSHSCEGAPNPFQFYCTSAALLSPTSNSPPALSHVNRNLKALLPEPPMLSLINDEMPGQQSNHHIDDSHLANQDIKNKKHEDAILILPQNIDSIDNIDDNDPDKEAPLHQQDKHATEDNEADILLDPDTQAEASEHSQDTPDPKPEKPTRKHLSQKVRVTSVESKCTVEVVNARHQQAPRWLIKLAAHL